MAKDRPDFWFTEDGDLQIDANGDLKDTESVFGRGLLQEIRMRLRGRPGDWPLNKALGCSLQDYHGEALTSKLVSVIQQVIVRALTSDGLVRPGSLEILPLVLSDSMVVFRIVIQTSEGELIESLGYDSNIARFIGY